MVVGSNDIKTLLLFIRLRQWVALSRDGDIVPRRCPILQVAMAYLTVRGKTLRGWVRDDPVSA
jgi:hypothetical protein